MDYRTRQSAAAVWTLAARQHGVIARHQLLGLGVHPQAIKHRVRKGRLHPIARGVYAVGRPQVTQHGKWLAAVLSCGSLAALSHFSAAALWGLRPSQLIEVSIRSSSGRRRPGITIHRRPTLTAGEITTHAGIPVTTPTCTLIDVAARLGTAQLERAVNEADALDLVPVPDLRAALDELPSRPGSGALKKLLDRRAFRLTRSELEATFIPLAIRAGLSMPLTGQWLSG